MRRVALLFTVISMLPHIIRADDFPTFSEYKITPTFRGKPASPMPVTTLSKDHIRIIRRAVRRGPNFASHYTVVDWGCGTSCGVYVIVDDRTGKIYEPAEISKGVELGVGGPKFRTDSNLMIVASCPPPETYGIKNCERNFYKWNGSTLEFLKKVPYSPVEK